MKRRGRGAYLLHTRSSKGAYRVGQGGGVDAEIGVHHPRDALQREEGAANQDDEGGALEAVLRSAPPQRRRQRAEPRHPARLQGGEQSPNKKYPNNERAKMGTSFYSYLLTPIREPPACQLACRYILFSDMIRTMNRKVCRNVLSAADS
eukprot:1190914-Prorocentrum_minimum.AAC.4